MKEGNAIEIRDLRKSFTLRHSGVGSLKTALLGRYRHGSIVEVEVLKGINLNVPWGQTCAIIGRNGAGKSTLLSLLAKVYRPSAGTIAINGRVAPLLELGAGFHPDLTGLENIFINGVILGMTRKEMMAKVDQIVEFSELEEKIDTPLRTYSSGMMMRLGFSIATHIDPEILIVDEALSVGDVAFQQKCFDRLKEFKDRKGTIFFVSHDTSTIRKVADRCVWMKGGIIHWDGKPDEVIDGYLVEMGQEPEQQAP